MPTREVEYEDAVTPAQESFMEKVSPEPMSGCWLWMGRADKVGYGRFGRGLLAHRAAWQLLVGPIPALTDSERTCVLHRCDVPSCVNPSHLFLGTQRENIADRDAKGRQARNRGELCGKSKLTAANVAVIRERRANGATLKDLGAQFGVHLMTIHGVVSHRTWRE